MHDLQEKHGNATVHSSPVIAEATILITPSKKHGKKQEKGIKAKKNTDSIRLQDRMYDLISSASKKLTGAGSDN